MRLVGKDKLQEFMERHPATKSWVEAWTKEVEGAQWRRPQDVKDRYSSASIIDNTTVIFNVKGNAYRMEVRISYQTGVVMVLPTTAVVMFCGDSVAMVVMPVTTFGAIELSDPPPVSAAIPNTIGWPIESTVPVASASALESAYVGPVVPEPTSMPMK